MPEPASTTTATIGAGAGALMLAMIGVEPQAVVWALVGAVFGSPLAPAAGRYRTVAVFVATVLACALFGTWASEYWHGGGVRARNGWAMGLAVVFHPLITVVVQSVPAVAKALVDALIQARIGGPR